MDRPTVIDLHCDTLTGCMAPGRCRDTLNDPASQINPKNLEELRWCQCCAIFIPDELTGPLAAFYYAHYKKRFDRQMRQFSHQYAPCRTADDVERAWAQGKTAAILTVENGSALNGCLERVNVLARDGVKMMTLTWNGQNQIASGWNTEEGLSSFGRAVIPDMEEQGILVDVSHLNDRSFFDVLDVVKKPFVASHSNARSVCGHRRNLTDDQIREMVRRRCLIGLNYADAFLREGGGAQPDDFFRHVERFLELGAGDCLALGSDFDGAVIPSWLDAPQKAAGLETMLLERGLPPALCEKLMYGNALAFFRANLN